jgi:chromosome segregation protein
MALKEYLQGRKTDITILEEEIEKARVEIARLFEATTPLNSEITRASRNIKRTKRNIKLIINSIQRFQERFEKDKERIEHYRTQYTTIQKEMRHLTKELTVLRKETDQSRIQEMEIQRENLGDKIIDMRKKLGEINTEYLTLQSKYENILKVGSNNIKIQLKRVERQLLTEERNVDEALQQKRTFEKELLTLEDSKEELSRQVLTAKEEAKKHTYQIDDIDKRLHVLDTEYEQTYGLFNKIQLNLQTCQLQLDQHSHQLMDFGYESPLEVSSEQLAIAESSLNLMKLELEQLGAVNQLAHTQYNEQISRYKELSVYINELELEKKSILTFVDEIEQKKRKIFINAFNQINESLSVYFSKITDGGEAALKLENVEDPFAGGIDMVVQFPGKPTIVVSGSSGGERSVATVAFIFALQDFMPAAFYLFDEIDAHLDAFHIEKMGELLTEESAKSQFLVVSLKPELVRKAERVFGIYAHDGASRVVSTTFAQITNRAV